MTSETAPHYLLLDDGGLREDGRFKMNPPLRSRADREALLEGVADGTIDMIATDHAPHAAEEKSKGLAGSASLEKLIDLMARNPRERFGIPQDGVTLWDLSREERIDPRDFLSAGKSTPFEGVRVRASCVATVYQGNIVYQANI